MKALLFKLSSEIATQYYLQFKEHCICISPPQEEVEKPAQTWVDEFNEKAGNGMIAQVMPLDFYPETVTREDFGVVEISDEHLFAKGVDSILLTLLGIDSAEKYYDRFGVTVESYE